MNKKEINKKIELMQNTREFSYRWCSEYHLQIKGRYTVNVWPTKKSYHVNGSNKKCYFKCVGDLVRIACGERNLEGVSKKSKRKHLKGLKSRLWDKGLRKCYVCKLKIGDISQASIEHIIPLSRGGSNRRDNLTLSHIDCNHKRKDSMIYDLSYKSKY